MQELSAPPTTDEFNALAVLLYPPEIALRLPDAVPFRPPDTDDAYPEAILLSPPLILAYPPLTTFSYPPEMLA